uniref:Fibronectin type-III domain-containing protein n=1 Tax=Candidatus Kentrum sp. FM TaxID=2126340 RepID=A0A450VM26_9GAMM|nr:MAG: hypothetical protein BECKFM1743A_GA0114220_1000817 [Candidatus Kentron sp. FM]VFJ43869.1 MAG: hypothetical protein BECKFM1743C_GA0114222_1000419 [Candidatus Kentron sp. FM]VFK05757.1 MAG: hypothetical protein BECKFM1743B_GA0114221_1000412 [Candidatus Kentron sp. FM]
MATYPTEEAKILILAQEMSSGLEANSDIYPEPPVDIPGLDEALTAYIAARDAAVAAHSAAEQATATKRQALSTLNDRIKLNLRYAERVVRFDDAKLKAIGWGGPKEPTPLAAPGRTRDLRIREQETGRISLVWKKPADGGKVAAYKVVFRKRATESGWNNAGMAISTELTLTGQPQGEELEYGVAAMNKAGEGEMSNTVIAAL